MEGCSIRCGLGIVWSVGGVTDRGGGKESHSSQGRAPLDLCVVVMGRLVLCAVFGARQFVSGTSSRSIID
jgi:hypothetical protein